MKLTAITDTLRELENALDKVSPKPGTCKSKEEAYNWGMIYFALATCYSKIGDLQEHLNKKKKQ